MYILTRKNRVIDYCESGYVYRNASEVYCEDKDVTFRDATIVNIGDKLVPSDIDCCPYEYIHGDFVKYLANSSIDLFVTVSTTGWSQDPLQGYSTRINLPGIYHTDNPIADIVLDLDSGANAKFLEAWSCISNIITHEDHITLFAIDAPPEIDFTIKLKVVR